MHAERETHLTGSGTRQELTQCDEIRVLLIFQPAPVLNRLSAKVSEMRDGATEGSKAELEKGPKHFHAVPFWEELVGSGAGVSAINVLLFSAMRRNTWLDYKQKSTRALGEEVSRETRRWARQLLSRMGDSKPAEMLNLLRSTMSEAESLNKTYRALGNAPVADGEGKSVVLRRTFAAEVTDAWKACTDKEQLAQWFSEVDGDFRQGGSFQVKDNAGGEVLHFEAPITLKTTWALVLE